ncbi:MAG: S41 family peptidase [Gudongella sp.]|nr:S41 family peptidase [Gudongella sp.]
MSKKKIVVLFVVLLLLTNGITFAATNIVGLSMGSKVVLNKVDYEELSELYKENSKIMMVKDVIDELYLREVNEEDLFEGQIKGMVNALDDPYSIYMTKSEFESFNVSTEGVYGGIGVIVTPGEDNLITVVSPIEDTPGERAGIKTGDKILKVNDEEFFADNMDEAVSIMRGEPETDVILTIMRKDKDGVMDTFEVSITREIIRLVSVKAGIVDGNLGYIRLTSFDTITADDFSKNLKELELEGAKGLIIDVRGNPGGLLNISVDIADALLGESTVVYTEDKNGKREYEKSDKAQTELPLVLLVDGGSASASEILAGAIKDNNRGLLIGTTTFGKGVVQRIKNLPDGSGVKITTSEYFSPNGVNIHGIGIDPDVEVELNEDVENIGMDYLEQDNQLQKAIEVLREEI